MSYKHRAALKAIEKVEKELQAVSDPVARERRKKAEKDFFFFCKTYLAGDFSAPPAEYQKLLVQIINKEAVSKEDVEKLKRFIHSKYHGYLKPISRLKGIVDIEPRGHGKSTRMALAYPLWRLLTKRSRFVVLVASSEREAQRSLKFIKWELLGNELIVNDFGNLRTETWRADYVELANGTAIQALGANSSMRGLRFKDPTTGKTFRPDLVICDDIMRDELAYSSVQREKLYDWFKRTVLPLGKDIFIVVINTIFHADDLPSRLLREIEEGKLSSWLGLRFSAFLEDGKTPLWPEYWSRKALEEKKQALGSLKFATEYMNEPLLEEDRLFKEEWFQFYSAKELPERDSLEVVMGVDPAVGKAGGDYSAIVVLGRHGSGLLYVLETYARKVSPTGFMDALFEIYERWKPGVILFETVAFQEVYKDEILREGSRRGIFLPIKEVKPRASKEVRAQKLAPLIENGLLLFRKEQKLLIQQLVEFPKGDHDDLVDALVYAVLALEDTKKKLFAKAVEVSLKSRKLVSGFRKFFSG
jgi:predicted phage terminase large subunit-like protein